MEYKADITNEEMGMMDPLEFAGLIVVVDSMPLFDVAMKEIVKHKMAGFDTETRPSFKKGVQHDVALLQIFCGRTCYLLRLNKIGFPDKLSAWFENEDIIKIGLSLRDDVRELRKKRLITPHSLIDLQVIVSDYGIDALSLKKIAAIVLGGRISKRQQLSNWESEPLTIRQKRYAATDAWVCLEIYNALIASEKKCR